MDLSNYAGIFILIILIGIALLMLAANWMGKQASSIFLVALIGVFVGMFIVELCDFKDASIETVTTIMVSALLPASIIVCRWAFQYIEELRNVKIYVLKTTIIKNIESRKRELIIEKENLEKELLINNSLHNLLTLLQLCISTNLNFYENDAMRIDREKRNELLKKINDMEKEIDIIDSRIEDLRTEYRYSHLLRIRRGGIK